MPRQRQQTYYIAAAVIAAVWLLSWAGYTLAKKSRMTAQRVYAYQNSLELGKMSAEERRKALQALMDMLNALPADERSQWHLDRDWFRQLTEEEKSWFIESFLPGEMKRALAYFERLPKAGQQKDIDDAMRELRQPAANPGSGPGGSTGGTNAPLVSPELDKKIRTMGLNALYSQGSAQTKAELAPLLLEVQRQMESGLLDANGF